MKLFKFSAAKTLTVDLPLDVAARYFRDALDTIGSCKSISNTENLKVNLQGRSNYGLQRVPVTIELERTENNSTSVFVNAKSDDIYSKGAQKCIERLLKVFEILQAGDKKQVEIMLNEDPFQMNIGFSRQRLFIFVAMTIVAIGLLALVIWR